MKQTTFDHTGEVKEPIKIGETNTDDGVAYIITSLFTFILGIVLGVLLV